MTKQKAPLFSFSAHGTIADQITFQKTGAGKISRRKPTPTDRRTIRQAYHRWDYQWYAYQWSLLSDAEKASYFTAGRAAHIPAFAAYIKTMLTDLPDLAGRWHLDALSLAHPLDTSKNSIISTGHNLTSRPAVIGNGAWFNGVNSYVDLGRPASLNVLVSQFSITMFINPEILDSDRDLFRKVRWTGAADNGGFIIRTIATGRIIFYVYIDTARYAVTAHNTLTTGEQHICVTYNDPVLKIYRNAVEVGTANWPGPIPNHDLGTAYLVGTSNYYRGVEDEVIIFNHTLTQPEIAILSDRSYPL